MSIVGHVESLWRYPVKSMRGEKLESAFVGFSGVYGDRLYAFQNSAAPAGFPYLTGRELEQMLLYQPKFRHTDKAFRPPNQAEAEHLAPGLTPVYPDLADLIVDVETPAGDVLAVDSPNLRDRLRSASNAGELTLLRSDRAMTDCRPISLISTQTVRALSGEVGKTLDQRRFRANVYLDLGAAAGSAEDSFVGRRVKLGAKAVVAVLERDPRCKMITLDPDTAQSSPEVLDTVAKGHEGRIGVYAAVLVEGTVRPGDEVRLLN
jgi:MOSC domain-containing protein